MNNYKLINRLFANIEGIVVIPTLHELCNHDILSCSEISLDNIAFDKSANKGYLNVALNTLASVGILNKKYENDDNNIIYKPTVYGKKICEKSKFISLYDIISDQLEKFIINDLSEDALAEYIELLKNYQDSIKDNITELHYHKLTRFAYQVEGVFIYPILLYNSYNNNKEFVYKDIVKDILSSDKCNDKNSVFNYLVKKSSSFGVTGSYQPIFSNLNKIIFSNYNLLYKRNKNQNEVHVNRKLNVWGSGGSHTTYFKKIDDLVIDIFNSPLNQQPLGIADMGCGDGMFIKHLNHLIKTKTLRGKNLKKYPLKFIAADLNKEALDSTRKNLELHDLQCYYVHADISNPQKFKDILQYQFNINISDLFHVRSFLDHNRTYNNQNNYHFIGTEISKCAFSHKGNFINSSQVKYDLVSHFKTWSQYIDKHGLLLLELHGVNTHNDYTFAKTPSVAYEATHGYSDQYIVEYKVFLECAKEAGLSKIEKYTRVFPDNELAMISINIFK